MRYKLRTLLIVLAIGPMLLAPLMVWGWREYQAYRTRTIHAPTTSGQPYVVSKTLNFSNGEAEQWIYVYSDGQVMYETNAVNSVSTNKKEYAPSPVIPTWPPTEADTSNGRTVELSAENPPPAGSFPIPTGGGKFPPLPTHRPTGPGDGYFPNP